MANKSYNVEEQMKQFSGWAKFRMIMGGVCFIASATFVMIHLGFVKEDYGHDPVPMKSFSRETLWWLNAGLGIGGGILLGYKHFFIAILSGLIASLAITGSALLYLSWRESILTVEIIIPMLAGLLGVVVYKKLAPNKQE